jgi:glutaredoxin
MNENPQAIPANWESCANKFSLDTDAINTCFNGQEGIDLLTASAANSQNAQASGSPTIVIDNVRYSGARGVNDFKRAFCNAFDGERPAACSDIPEPTKFDVVVLNDNRCADCQAAQASLVSQLKGLFPGMQVQTVDYMSAEGKELYASTGAQFLPAFLFTDGVSKDENYAQVQPYLNPAGDYTTLLVGANFDPTKEICDNNIDDTNNGNVDCDDSDCSESLSCREEKSQQLQVFIMSDCPYGKEAVKALNTVENNFGDNLDFEIHYIASEQGDGFNSLHGQYEVDENIKQLCVKEHSPDVWFDYMLCRSVNGIKNVDWNACATEANVDIDAVSACFEGDEGANLLREDIKIANALGISASPTWMANNRYQFSGIDAETVKTNFCQYNQGVAGCENVLSTDTGGVPASGSC